MDTSCERAARATFAGLANCYWREADRGIETTRAIGDETAIDGIEWRLVREGVTLFAELVYRSLTGPHRFGRLWKRSAGGQGFEPIDSLWATLLIIRECYAEGAEQDGAALRQHEIELIGRVVSSCQAMRTHLDCPPARRNSDGFIEAEQSLTYGHWLHPTPKSRQGMTDWQEPAYAPERRGHFALTLFAADGRLVRHDSAAGRDAPSIAESLVGRSRERLGLRKGEVLLPAHPLQAEALLLDPDVAALIAQGRLRRIDTAGPAFTATSSVRTVYNADLPWMLKFSLPVRITNSLRINRREELAAGVAMARLLRKLPFPAAHPKFRLVADPAYLTIDLPGRSESGFEVIFRENPFTGTAQNGIVTIAALTADPRPGERSRLDRLVRDIAARTGITTAHAARLWFGAYLDCALDPAILLYDRHGIALEAHQQNSLLDVSNGWPATCYYRDNQGYYLSAAHRRRLTTMLPELAAIPSMFFDDADIRRWFAYYLVVNQIFSVVSRMGCDGHAEEQSLVAMLAARLEGLAGTLQGVGRDFASSLLERPEIASKANLMTRVRDIDEFDGGAGSETTLFAPIANPIFAAATGREVRDALAS
jgi:spermidine-citrate ligase